MQCTRSIERGDSVLPPHHPPLKPHLLISSIRPTQYLALHQVSPNKQITETITHGTQFPRYPAFSPDGQWLLFSSEKGGKTSLYIRSSANPNEEPRKLTDGAAFEGQVSISSKGYIYFTSSHKGTLDIFRARFTPSEVIRMETAVNLTNGLGSNFSPAVSPDGERLAFTSNRHSTEKYRGPIPPANYKAGCVYMMSAVGDGSDAEKISSGVDAEGRAEWQGGSTWSKAGESIIFYAGQGEHIQLRRYDCATKTITPIGPTKGKSFFPTTHPVTGEIVFAHQKEAPKASEHHDRAEKRWKIKQLNGQKLFSLKGRHCWGAQFKSDGSFILNATTETEAPTVIEKVEKGQMQVSTVQVYFPIKEGDKLYGVERMSKVTETLDNGKQRDIFAPESAVFGLAKAPKCNWLLTTVGTPFADSHQRNFSTAHIFKVFLDGSKPVNLTAALPGRNVWPTINAEGTRIIFVHQKEGEKDKHLYAMDADGQKFRPLTEGAGVYTMPDYARDGKKVVFSYTSDGVSYRLKSLMLNEDSTPGKIEDLTEEGSAHTHPSISPDGTKIAYSSDHGQFNEEDPYSRLFFNPQPYGDVYVRDILNKSEQRMTDTTYEQSTPGWERI